MHARYYALRRVNPFRGLVLIVDAGDATAHTYDGITWHLRSDDGFGWVRPTGIWVEDEGLRAGVASRHGELVEALESHPPVPFPLADRNELWLLDLEQGRPLALLDTARPSHFAPGRIQPEWQPFPLRYTGFRSPTLTERDLTHRDGGVPHRDVLARIVNNAARPYARAQWFHRRPDGSGEGLTGHRINPMLHGRVLEPSAFPELLLRTAWNSRLEQSVINDYHAWVSPLLLLLPDLSDATRNRLEEAARMRARWLLKRHRLLPKVIDEARLNAMLVSARLEEATGAEENDPMLE